jgi:hypothetical protein
MSTPQRNTAERAFLEDVAKQYRDEGYQVQIEPDSASLPPFLRVYHPDMVATRDGESVVVEVKRNTSKADLQQLAAIVARQPGWRFDLVLYEPERDTGDEMSSVQTIRATLDEARRLYSSQQASAGLLLAWSAFEAASRVAFRRRGIERLPRPEDLLKNLVFEDLISEEEFKSLLETGRLRNRVAHGALELPVPDEALGRLTELARRLLGGPSAEAA